MLYSSSTSLQDIQYNNYISNPSSTYFSFFNSLDCFVDINLRIITMDPGYNKPYFILN